MSEQKWIPFDLDVNFFWGSVDSAKKWNEIVARYRRAGSSAQELARVKQTESENGDSRPGFSFKGTGPTLAVWAKENGVDLIV